MKRLQSSSQASAAPDPVVALTTAGEMWPHLDEAQTATAQTLLVAAQLPSDIYTEQVVPWIDLASSLPDSSSRNSASQNAVMMELWTTLDRDGTWAHPTAGYGTEARAAEARQSWADYLSWLAGAPTYEYNGSVPAWGWSGYINSFQSWHGWVMGFVPNKYGHLL